MNTTGTAGDAGRQSRWAALAALCVSKLSGVLSFQTAVIALPSIGQNLQMSAGMLQWVLGGNALAFGSLLLLAGRAGDLFGHRRLFLLGSALSSAAAFGCGLAPNGATLIAACAIQGIAMAMFVPASLALLAAAFPEGPDRDRALGIWGAFAPVGGILGLTLGGVLVGELGWQWVFFLNGPLPLIALVSGSITLPRDPEPRSGRHLDVAGAATLSCGMVALVYGLTQLSAGTGSWQPVVALIIAGSLIGAFIGVERRAAQPLIPPRFLRRPAVLGPNVVSALHGAATNTPIVFFTLYMQDVRGYSPLVTGLAFLPCNAALLIAYALGARLIGVAGRWRTIVVGMALLIVGLALMAGITTAGGYTAALLPGLIVWGVGLSVAQIAIIGAATAAWRSGEHGLAAGLVSTTAQLGTSIGLATLTAVASTRTGIVSDAVSQPTALAEGYRWAFLGAGGFAALGLLVALAILRRARWATGSESVAPGQPQRRSTG